MAEHVQPGLDIAAFARAHRVRFVRKDASRLMRLLGWLFGLVGYDFMRRAWTTIGRTVYYPTHGPGAPDASADWAGYLESYRPTIEHEFHHVLQFERLWHLHSLLYLLGVPLPVGLAWYRWRCEREPYLHQLRHYPVTSPRDDLTPELLQAAGVEVVAGILWRVYGWPWPRAWMRRWFLRELGR